MTVRRATALALLLLLHASCSRIVRPSSLRRCQASSPRMYIPPAVDFTFSALGAALIVESILEPSGNAAIGLGYGIPIFIVFGYFGVRGAMEASACADDPRCGCQTAAPPSPGGPTTHVEAR